MISPIHPFPARMAPELATAMLGRLPPGSRVLDPMCGSGTVIRQAVEAGHRCVGLDLDPLAVLLTRAWVTPSERYRIVHDAHHVIERARNLKAREVQLPWNDDETDRFARYWFAEPQLSDLARLAQSLQTTRLRSRDLLRVSFSRLIITKDAGASLARDVSHSRPHRVRDTNDFDVFAGFLRAARLVASRHRSSSLRGSADVFLGDARANIGLAELCDLAITSPPYLNAIDYMRGHRLTLIWFGYDISSLQRVRANSTGSERAQEDSPFDVSPHILAPARRPLGERYVGWVRRYAADTSSTMTALKTTVRRGGNIMLVVGNSLIRGAAVDNAAIAVEAARRVGLELVSDTERNIPARRRYLPPPKRGSALGHRMRRESVLVFSVP